MHKNLRTLAYAFALTAFFAASAFAKTTKNDQAPPPPAVPVPSVDATPLDPTNVEGTATAVDGDTLRVGESLVRIYGIATPGIGEKLGPDARSALDGLVTGQRVSCTLFGKLSDGTQLGQCRRDNDDPAEKLLAAGLAAVYRIGPVQADLAKSYDATEAEARQHNLGIWAKPAAAAQPDMHDASRWSARAIGIAMFALLLLAILTVSITHVSIARTNRKERARLRHARRYTLSTGLAAEAEIIRAAAQGMADWIKEQPQDRPLPIVGGAALGIPGATFWNANVARVYVLPVEITVPLLRFHALHEDTVRKIAIKSAIPTATLAEAVNGLIAAATKAIGAIEHNLGIVPKIPAEPKLENPTAT